MTFIHVLLAIPAAFFIWTLVRDFFAGLDEERLWSDPERDQVPAGPGGPEWEPLSCRVYEFRSSRSGSGSISQLPLDREA